jgi:hypothetical protein
MTDHKNIAKTTTQDLERYDSANYKNIKVNIDKYNKRVFLISCFSLFNV